MIGTRLGVICEGFALTGLGLLFGLLFSWQLTIIGFLPLIAYAMLGLTDIRINMSLKDQVNMVFERASAVN